MDEVLYTAEKCIKHVQRLREMRLVFIYLNQLSLYKLCIYFPLNFSPLWEMHQEGIDIKSIKWSQH